MKDFFKELKWIIECSRKYWRKIIIDLIINVITSLSTVATALATKALIDAATTGNVSLTFTLICSFLALIIIQVAMNAADSIISSDTYQGLSNDIRQRMFSRIAKSEWLELSKYHSGDILNRLTSDADTISNGAVIYFPQAISMGVRCLAAFVTLLVFDPVLSVFAFVLGPATIIFSRFFGQQIKKLHLKSQEAESLNIAFINESLLNMFVIKAFGLERTSSDNLNELQKAKFHIVKKRNRMNAAAGSVFSLGFWGGYFAALLWGAYRIQSGAITFGTLTAFIQLVGQIQGPFIALYRALPQIITAFASTERLMEIEELQAEEDSAGFIDWDSAGINMEGVTFYYDKKETILDDISFNISPGEIAAVTGTTGEGKTTLIRLLISLVKPVNGKIFFYKHEDRIEASPKTRKLVSYVPQGNTLFSGTIAENLRAVKKNAADTELEEALRAACAWDFVINLSDGIDTRIGERGLGISEGQAQRIAIARALLRKAPVLILDEATSALDIETEKKLLEEIGKLTPAVTCIIVTHRKAALSICSKVFKLEEGKMLLVKD